jgi:hypothetical protein
MLGQAAALFGAGLVAGGIVAGTVAASAATGAGSPSPRPGAGSQAPGPGNHPFFGPGGRGFGHGFGLPLSGTVTSVGSSSVTIRTQSGTKTYAVDGASDIDKNGEAKLSDLVTGDKVRFAVRPGTSSIAVLHAGTEALNAPDGRHRGRGGHCDHGSGTPAPTPTQTTGT